MADTPAYLEAPTNEDSGAFCVECGDPADDAAPSYFEPICPRHYDEYMYEKALEERAEELADREYDDEPYYYDE